MNSSSESDEESKSEILDKNTFYSVDRILRNTQPAGNPSMIL